MIAPTKEQIEEVFERLYPNCDVDVVNGFDVSVEVRGESEKISLSFAKLMEIGKLFGTMEFDFSMYTDASSSGTMESWDYYEITFTVDREKIGNDPTLCATTQQ